MKLYNCPYKGDMCFLYGNCEECAYHKSMKKNREYRKTIKELKDKNAELQKQVDELTAFKNEAISLSLYGVGLKDGKQQAVKDTAKEIFETLFNECWAIKDENGYKMFIESKIKHIAKERYGVEVE